MYLVFIRLICVNVIHSLLGFPSEIFLFSLKLIMALHWICLIFYALIKNSFPNPMGSTHPSVVSLLETLFHSSLSFSFLWTWCFLSLLQNHPPQMSLPIILGIPSLLCCAKFTLCRISCLPASNHTPFLLRITSFWERSYDKGDFWEILNGWKCLYSCTTFE